MWLAIAITVAIVMPLALWLGEYSFALWCSFIVWSEFFLFGANVSCLKLIIPTFSLGVVLTAITLLSIPVFDFLPSLISQSDISSIVALFLGVAFMAYIINLSDYLKRGTLPYFNGVSMMLAIFYTGSFPSDGLNLPDIVVASLWTVFLGCFGGLMGVFTVWLTFSKE
ncbi:DUF1097 family protein [Dasania sp. GY-MA-18]|uniref:DUF1097 family protein n=1 Tax=Dasania phycosphaerae TaxID=2950436 RepID=A0A9J6RLI9_9GAMM|nr:MULTISPECIES: DUF1097 family protein [Dasania]MCR8922642.1 DUF1097 family protein [Dasania sp. GY-MA-18]MCZ0865072.1 DUF1097 family protein [Dasania phycosphaerae]MCZ0868798.1 DUF1097 family protein [Dasania phycosphaerae]